MAKLIDITGQRFGALTVIGRAPNPRDKRVLWECKCDCGNTCVFDSFLLRRGDYTSCGCKKYKVHSEPRPIKYDLTGQRFGALTVIEHTQIDGKVMWRCHCDCGKDCVKDGSVLRNGSVTSCGCGMHRFEKKRGQHYNITSSRRGRSIKKNDYTGQTFGLLAGVQSVQSGHSKDWLWKCACGNLLFAHADDVVNGKITSCGCDSGDKSRRIEKPILAAIMPENEYTDMRKAPRNTNGSKISKMRIACGLTQAKLADMVGVRCNVVSLWEHGKVKPSKASLMNLAGALNCRIEDLVELPKPKCRVCGGDINPPRKVFCSDACTHEWKNIARRVENPRKRSGGSLYIPRICIDCGKEYIGHIKTIRCPECQAEATRRNNMECKQRKAKGLTRKIGSTDYCQRCGKPYIVCGGNQRYCKDCSEIAWSENVRAHNREWNKKYYSDAENREKKNSGRRKDWMIERNCTICGKAFMPSYPKQITCSDACHTARIHELQRAADAKRRPKKEDHND